jgi:hypothetical protein
MQFISGVEPSTLQVTPCPFILIFVWAFKAAQNSGKNFSTTANVRFEGCHGLWG